MVLEVVVGVGDVVFAGVGVLGGHRDPSVRGAHVVDRRHTGQVAAVGVAAPGGVDAGQVGVVAPVAGVDELQQTRTVRAGFGPEHPRRGPAPVPVFGQ